MAAAAVAQAQGQGNTAAPESPQTAEGAAVQVLIQARRLVDAAPLPGLDVGVDQIPANVQSATRGQLKASRATNLAEHFNTQMQGVSVNDYAGNPFQLDLNYRGFTASPQVGTPQGLSVFFDGVRVNEPFGDVVNWDLIPVNAIERLDLFPGSNPVFGLNTLGGAVSVRSRNGFSSPGFEGSVLAGSWKRRQVQMSAGGNNGTLAGFAALNVFDEAGWRDDSPSRVRQFYARGDWMAGEATLGLSFLGASNRLVGNGLVPIEAYEQRPQSVFTSPDSSANDLAQWTLSGSLPLARQVNVTGKVYHRLSKRSGVNGDIYEEFQDLGRYDVVYDWQRIQPSRPVCQFAALNAAGAIDPSKPLNGPVGMGCDFVQYAPSPDAGRPRNGGYLNAQGTQEPGVADGGTPIGLLTSTALRQVTDGLGLQFNWNLDRHKVMVGAVLDRSRARYEMRQRLGMIDADHRVYTSPDEIAPGFAAAFTDVVGNQFEGWQDTRSLYASDVWSAQPNLHITAAARYNRTDATSRIGSRVRFFNDIGDVQGSLPTYIVCPTSDPASCPSAPVPTLDPATTVLQPVDEHFRYTSFNPAVGFNWLPDGRTNLFGNLSRGARVPSVVELGCALDLTPTPYFPNDPSLGSGPRSLLGASCNLPTTLSGDPYLPQIRATSGELGLRGRLAPGWDWNGSLFRTDLKDDIYLVAAGSGRSYFDTIGKTRRQGLELGVRGRQGPWELSANYAYVDATFQSTFYMLSPYNSTADFDQNSRTRLGDPLFFKPDNVLLPSPQAGLNRGLGTYRSIRVDPGARMPGIPAHNFSATARWQVSPEFKAGLTMVARSGAYMRGNENNQHQPEGTDQQIGQYYCNRSDCAITGYEQLPVPVGRPFTRTGWLPGYAVFNLDASWKIDETFELALQVANLFDRRYVTAGRLGTNPFSPSTVGETGASGWNYNASEWQNTSFISPGAPRALWLSLNWTLDAN